MPLHRTVFCKTAVVILLSCFVAAAALFETGYKFVGGYKTVYKPIILYFHCYFWKSLPKRKDPVVLFVSP